MRAAGNGIRVWWKGLMLAVSLIALVGCGASAKRVYQPNLPDAAVHRLNLKVAVVELEDESSQEAVGGASSLIPGHLSGIDLTIYHFTMFGTCLANELKGSQLFASVDYYANWEKLAGDFKSYDLIVTGRLLADRVQAESYWYGLSAPGAVLWFLGLPVRSVSRDVDFEVTAFAPLHPANALWNYRVSFTDLSWEGFFYGGAFSDHKDLSGLTDPSSILKSHFFQIPIQHTDLCTTEKLQPPFMGMRKHLASTLNGGNLSQGVGLSPQGTKWERSGP